MPEEECRYCQQGIRTANLYFCGELLDISYSDKLGWEHFLLPDEISPDARVAELKRELKEERRREADGAVTEFLPDRGYWLKVRVDQAVAGSSFAMPSGEVSLIFRQNASEELKEALRKFKPGKRYFFKTYHDPSYLTRSLEGCYGEFDIKDCLIVMEIEDNLWAIPLQGNERVQILADERFSTLRPELEMLEDNLRSVEVLTSKDMSAMPDIQEVSQITSLQSGRWLNRRDDLDKKQVCVIPGELAILRGLRVGDSLSLLLRKMPDFQPFLGEQNMSDWKSYPTEELTLEIVGITPTSALLYTDSIFVPDSIVSERVSSSMDEGFLSRWRYSFVLEQPEAEEQLIRSYADELSQHQISFSFIENNGKAYWQTAGQMRRDGASGLAVYSTILILVFFMSAMLYLWQRRQDYAVQRALGVAQKELSRELFSAFLVLSLPALLLGTIVAHRQASLKCRETLAALTMPSGVEANVTISCSWPLLLIGLMLLLLSLFLFFLLRSLQRRSIVTLLQGQNASTQTALPQSRELRGQEGADLPKRRGADSMPNNLPALGEEAAYDFLLASDGAWNFMKGGKLDANSSRRAMRKVARKHFLKWLVRKAALTVLLFSLACGFLLSLLVFEHAFEMNKEHIEQLYRTTRVNLTFVSTHDVFADRMIIPKMLVDSLLDSGFIESAYLEGCFSGQFYKSDEQGSLGEEIKDSDWLAGIPSFDAYFASFADSQVLDDFYYDENWQNRASKFVFAPGWDYDRYNRLLTENKLDETSPTPALFSARTELGRTIKDGEVIYVYGIDKKFHAMIRVGSQPEDGSIWVPQAFLERLRLKDDGSVSKGMTYRRAHLSVKPEKNRELAHFFKSFEDKVSEANAFLFEIYPKQWHAFIPEIGLRIEDAELRNALLPLEKNHSLLLILFPITVAAFMILCFVLLLLLSWWQRSEFALIQVLGVGKMSTALSYGFCQLAVLAAGALSSLLALPWLQVKSQAAGKIGLYGLLFFASALAGIFFALRRVFRQSPMDMLQAKD